MGLFDQNLIQKLKNAGLQDVHWECFLPKLGLNLKKIKYNPYFLP